MPQTMKLALLGAGPAIVASGLTVIAALLCLSLAELNSTASMGPIGAIGIFMAMLSMLTFRGGVAPSGIYVYCLAPGWVETPILENLPDNIRPLMTANTPLGRIGKPEEIASVALFLASDESSYIVGQIISPNGGLHT